MPVKGKDKILSYITMRSCDFCCFSVYAPHARQISYENETSDLNSQFVAETTSDTGNECVKLGM